VRGDRRHKWPSSTAMGRVNWMLARVEHLHLHLHLCVQVARPLELGNGVCFWRFFSLALAS